jgi:hypothetical protein
VLVVAEVGLAVMLLVGAALLARSFEHLVEQDPGFKPARVVTVNLELPYSYADFKKIADFYGRLLASLRAQPGVRDAGLANFLPLQAAWRLPFLIDGRPRPAAADAPQAQNQSVDEDYFRVIGVPLVRMALGARPRDVLWLVVKQGLWLTIVGSVAGVAGAFALGRTLSSLLYGVSSGDTTAFVAAVMLAAITALAACALPARRAASIDPLAGLRAD